MLLVRKKQTVSIGLVNHSRQGEGGKGRSRGRMIWDAIDLIMPLRGLLSLSCLDLL